MIYGYARCSTNETKQNIDRQLRDIESLANGQVHKVFSEYESGAKEQRKELNNLIKVLKEGDTIVCTEVSRITRSTKQLCEIIELAKTKKLKLILGAFILDCTKQLDPMTEGMLKMMGVFSEMEKDIIKQRVKSGLKNAKAKGKILGRRKTTVDDIPDMFLKYCNKYNAKKITKIEFSKLCGLSRPTIDKYLKILNEI